LTGGGLDWEARIGDEEWRVYRRVIQEARAGGIRLAFGGAFATAVYTGELRNTKDLDLYVLPPDRERMIEATARAGLEDYFERLPYDREWIYRASQGDVIVDVIWAMANQRTSVDSVWLTNGPSVRIRGEELRAIPIEELIWSKLYVMQRERCDWGDVLNLVGSGTDSIDWARLVDRLAEDAPLLAGALSVFGWLDSVRAQKIPRSVWDGLGLKPPPPVGPANAGTRANLLDSRPWFLPSSS
jgi:hypothetical protein